MARTRGGAETEVQQSDGATTTAKETKGGRGTKGKGATAKKDTEVQPSEEVAQASNQATVKAAPKAKDNKETTNIEPEPSQKPQRATKAAKEKEKEADKEVDKEQDKDVKTEQAPSEKKPNAGGTKLSSKGRKAAEKPIQVRVWWPPTANKKKTSFSGMYWPASVLLVSTDDCGKKKYKVQYDNEEIEIVEETHIFPRDVPMDFGEETVPFVVGEFVEVFNNSPTDPAAWLARIKNKKGKQYVVDYPFHDARPEPIEFTLLRRALVYDSQTQQYLHVKPGQRWHPGEVVSPLELEKCTKDELFKLIDAASKETPKYKTEKPEGRPDGAKGDKQEANAQKSEKSGSSKQPKESKKAATARKKKAGADIRNEVGHSNVKRLKMPTNCLLKPPNGGVLVTLPEFLDIPEGSTITIETDQQKVEIDIISVEEFNRMHQDLTNQAT